MILKALSQLSDREGLVPDPDFERRPIAWLVRVADGGKLLGIQGTHYLPAQEGKKKPKPVAKQFVVPLQPDRCGKKPPPYLLVDNAKYVFGYGDPNDAKEVAKAKLRAPWFREEVAKCAEATDDPAVRAVLAFLDRVAAGQQTFVPPAEWASNDQFAFIYDPDLDLLVHDREAVRDYWRGLRATESQAAGQKFTCLVSEEIFSGMVGNFPQVKRVPGGQSTGASLISFNSNAFESYGWKFNENAPISDKTAQACSRALQRLVDHDPKHPSGDEVTLGRRNIRLSADTLVCYWSAKEEADEFCSVFGNLLQANPEEVGEAYRSIWRGQAVALEDPAVFYALTISGAQGRIIVRTWLESTVQEVSEKLAQHFSDLDMVRNTPAPKNGGHPPGFPLSELLRCLAPFGDSKNIPAPHVDQIFWAALKGTPYPFSLLQRAVQRARAEIGNTEWPDKNRADSRAALIKAVLNRRKRFHPGIALYPEVKRDMDPTNSNQGYILGRLMATLERLQQVAIGDVNASVVDKFFSGASANPRSVFVRLLKNAQHHARKAKSQPSAGAMPFLLERLTDDLADRFDPREYGFPARLDLESQGLFVLGYHQMRKWLWMSKDERVAWEAANPDASKAYRWSKEKPVNYS